MVKVSFRNFDLNIRYSGVTIYGYKEFHLFHFIFLAKDVSFIFQINTTKKVLERMMNTHQVKQKDNNGKIRTGIKASVVIFPIH